MTDRVRITSDNQNMWATGEAAEWSWFKYLPLIGGDMDMTLGEATGVRFLPPDGEDSFVLNNKGVPRDGEVVLEDGEVVVKSWPGIPRTGRLDTKEFHTLPIEIDIEGLDGSTSTRQVDVIWHNRPLFRKDGDPWTDKDGNQQFGVPIRMTIEDAGLTFSKTAKQDTGNFFWTDGKTTYGNAIPGIRFEGVSDLDRLNDPHRFTGDRPSKFLDIDIDLKRDIMEAADKLTKPVKAVKEFLSGLADKIADSAVGKAAGKAVEAAEDAWNFAKGKVPALKAIEGVAVSAANDAYKAAKGAARTAEKVIEDLTDEVFKLGKKIFEGGKKAVKGLFDEIGDAISTVTDTLEGTKKQKDKAEKELDEARNDLEERIGEARDAGKALDAAEALKETLDGRSLDDALEEAAAAKAENRADIFALRDALDSGLGKAQWRKANDDIKEAVDALDASLQSSSTARTEGGFFDDVLGYARKLDPLSLVESLLDKANLKVRAKAMIEADAQAGILLQAELNGGEVDSELLYRVDVQIDPNEAADTYTFTVDPAIVNDTEPGFTTQSPYATFRADMLYNVGGSFNLDFMANIAGTKVIESFSQELRTGGAYTFVDIDTREIEIELTPPGFLGDIVTLTLRGPNIQTEGMRTTEYRDEYDDERAITFSEFVKQAYDDPDSTDIDQLAKRLLNLIKPEIGFSEGFAKFLDDQGKTVDVSKAGLLKAIVQTIGLLGDAAVDFTLLKDGETDAKENEYKDSDGYLPIFEIRNEAKGNDGLIHIDILDNPTFDGDLDRTERLGFFTAKGRTVDSDGEAANVIDLEIDVDQLVATVVNVALGNTPETTINPLDLSIGLSDIFGDDDKKDDKGDTKDDSKDDEEGVEDEFFASLEDYLTFEAGFEVADLDVHAGVYASQTFALAVEDMEYELSVEGAVVGAFSAATGGKFVLENASSFVDADGDGLDYDLALKPSAEFFNDTQIGLNIGYQLDILKARMEFLASLPKGVLTELLGDLGLPTGARFDAGLGPLLRASADVDLLSLDVFEDAFAFAAGTGSLTGKMPGLREVGPFTFGTERDDLTFFGGPDDDRLDGLAGRDRIYGVGGNDILRGGADDDVLYGGQGIDSLDGGTGNDELVGGDGDDVLNGGPGDDKLFGGLGNDVMSGDEGNDRLQAGLGKQVLTGGEGNDFFFFDAARMAGEMDDILVTITDFTPHRDGMGDYLRITNALFGDRIYATASTEGDNVRVKVALASKLDDPEMHRALAEGGRAVLFENSSLDDVTAGLEREGAFLF